MTGPVVECREVARTYGRGRTSVVAVHAVTCRLGPGEQVAVTGPSGSGKSTLLHLISGLDAPTAGQIAWPALGGNPLRRAGTMGIVFQGPSLLPPLDVLENVALPLLLAGRTETAAHKEARAALDATGIGDLAGKLPEELSGGQAQRAAVARVLAAAPRLIIADEPTGQLDSAHAAQVVDLLITVARDTGATLLLATHDVRMAERLPGRWEMTSGVLREGEPCSP